MTLRRLLSYSVLLLLTACVAPRPLDRTKSAWNEGGVWKKLPGAGESFVPWDLPAKAPIADKDGEWITDGFDGYRFFIPKGGTRSYTEAILAGEVKKVTNPYSRENHTRYVAMETVRLPLAFTTFGIIRPKSWEYGMPGQSSSSSTVSTSDDDDDDDWAPMVEDEPAPQARRGISPASIPSPPPTPPAPPTPELPRPERPEEEAPPATPGNPA